jgi:hypothetical protein
MGSAVQFPCHMYIYVCVCVCVCVQRSSVYLSINRFRSRAVVESRLITGYSFQ